MQTPAGKECPYFYGDYHRGRSHEECRLLGESWAPDLCFNCPTPEIKRANACEHMVLQAQVRRTFWLLKRRVEITAFCTKSERHVDEPHIGCGQCHPLPPFFSGEVREFDPPV